MDRTFIQARIDATKTAIVAYETAAEAFATNGVIQTYKLDTGQSVQTVTRADLDMITKTINSLYNRCATLEARLNGASSLVTPAW